jgi:hypothetical protein
MEVVVEQMEVLHSQTTAAAEEEAQSQKVFWMPLEEAGVLQAPEQGGELVVEGSPERSWSRQSRSLRMAVTPVLDVVFVDSQPAD